MAESVFGILRRSSGGTGAIIPIISVHAEPVEAFRAFLIFHLLKDALRDGAKPSASAPLL